MSTTIVSTQDNLTTPGYNTELAPIIIDLGKAKRKRIKALKRGRGKLMAEVSGVINEARINLGTEANGKGLIPVILIYRQKRKRKKAGLALPFPFPFLGR
jgi:hypothetical protein